MRKMVGIVILAVLAGQAGLADGTLTATKRGERVAQEKLPDGRKLVGIDAYPEAIHLSTPYALAQVVLTGVLDNGDRIDVTRLADVQANDLVSVTATRRVSPVRDGDGELRFSLNDHSVRLPVTVSGQDAPYAVSFIRDVMPLVSRIGCNAGTCHGSARGKNGFKLSLRGYDPVYDHRALTDDLKGRRFNRASPDKSLFLMKISGKVPHTGVAHVVDTGPHYKLLRSWVTGGVKYDADAPRVTDVSVFPQSTVVSLPGMRQQLAVLATYSDGSVRDVTAESFIDSSNTEVATVDDDKIVTAVRRGETAALVRFEGRYAAARLFVMGDRSGFVWQDPPTDNYIDELVYAKLKTIKSLPSEPSTDYEFIRRIHLDLTGLPPGANEVRIFLDDTRDSKLKRGELIDRLIGGPEFVEFWTNKWADLLQVNSKFLGPDGAAAFRNWIRQSVVSNTPYDQFVLEVLNSSGSTLKNPATAYYKVLRKADEVMENTTQLFLGIRFNCNKCHDHPFERWTQQNHWQLAAFFAQVDRKDAPGSQKMPRRSAAQQELPAFEELVSDSKEGEVSFPNGGTAHPEFPYEYATAAVGEESRRGQLSKWITARENPYFAKSYVNRLWSYLLGVGIIEPVDDIRAGNPPTNPELLARLTKEFLDGGFNVRKMIRDICRSRVYQQSIKTNSWNEDDDVNFSHALARRLPAETLYDAIHRVTGSVSRLPGNPRGTRAAELLDPSTKLEDGFLDLFGRPPRESACECERSSGMSLGQALTMVNGPTVSAAINDPTNDIAELVKYEPSPAKIVEQLFLSILARLPMKEEAERLSSALDHRDLAASGSLPPEKGAELSKRLESWAVRQRYAEWEVVDPSIRSAESGATMTLNEDGSVLVGGVIPETEDTYTIVTLTRETKITGFRLEVLPDPSLKLKDVEGPGRSESGEFHLNDFRIAAAPADDPTKVKLVAFQNLSATFVAGGYNLKGVTDEYRQPFHRGWAVDSKTGAAHHLFLPTTEDVGFENGTILTITMLQNHDKKKHQTIGKFRISVTKEDRDLVRVREIPEDLLASLGKPKEERTADDQAIIYRHFIQTDPQMQQSVRLAVAQDIAWALINSPAFLFNR